MAGANWVVVVVSNKDVLFSIDVPFHNYMGCHPSIGLY